MVIPTLLMLAACEPDAPPPRPVRDAHFLARDRSAVLDLTLSPRNHRGDIPERFPISNGWQKKDVIGDLIRYEAPNPIVKRIRPVLPSGYTIVSPTGAPLPYSDIDLPDTWAVDGDRLLLRLPKGEVAIGYAVRHPETSAHLSGLSFETAGRTPEAFTFRSERLKGLRRHGIYLPAPSAVTFAVAFPPDGTLLADVAMMRSRWKDAPPSDGMTLIVEVHPEGAAADGFIEVFRRDLASGTWTDLDVDLSAYAGQQGTIRMRTEPGDTPIGDFLLVGDPVLYTPKDNPRRIVLVFVDTLRADRMGMFGYERDTTPNLDRWAKNARRLSGVRTVAPWTYPAMKAALSGRLPDRWDDGPVLAERMAEAGWVTIGLFNNAYLSHVFGMDRGWGWHFYVPDLKTPDVIRTAMGALDKNPDRDTLIVLQLMDVHLPYAEPEPYRSLWASAAPAGLADPIRRSDVLNHDGDPAARKAYLSDRYDQSLRYLDRQLMPLLNRLDENDAVIFFSDHGEELFDHGGFAHGHSLYEELLRVPVVIAGPGVTPGDDGQPRSLIDLVPTVLDLADAQIPDDLTGRSMLSDASDAPQPFGHLLYGVDAWGAHHEGDKWIVQGTQIGRFDLKADPSEQTFLPDTRGVDVVGQAFDRAVVAAQRMVALRSPPQRPRTVRLQAPGGFRDAWAGMESPEVALPTPRLEGDALILQARNTQQMPLELFLQTHQADAAITILGEGAESFVLEPVRTLRFDEETVPIRDAAVQSQLRALGYQQ
ncbi:MAG: sulfatase [Myxococcota bacterium]